MPDIAGGVLPAGICKTQFFFLSHLSVLHTITWEMVNVFVKIHVVDSTLKQMRPYYIFLNRMLSPYPMAGAG